MLLEDRERAEEALFVHRQELAFAAHAHRNKLFGLWAAHMRGLSGPAAQRYAMSLVLEDFPHYRAQPVLQRVSRELAAAGQTIDGEEIAAALARSADRAQEEAMTRSGTHLCC